MLTGQIYLYIFKTNVMILTDEYVDACLRFSVHVTSEAFERVLSFSFNAHNFLSLLIYTN